MTQPETRFADEDRAMARRALWLLDGHRPGNEQPPLDLDLDRFKDFVGAGGFLRPLAHFGQTRRDDALRATGWTQPPSKVSDNGLPLTPPLEQNGARAAASLHEKRASDALRAARTCIRNAASHWRVASELRAEDLGKVGVLFLGNEHADVPVLQGKQAAVVGPTGEHEAILAELSAMERAIDGAVRRLAPALRRVDEGDPFPSTLGLPKAERNAELNAQAMYFFDAGQSLEEVAYVMGWYCGTIEETQDRTHQRIALARARARGASGNESADSALW